MGWYDDLSAGIQAQIEKKIGAQPFFEIIFDPDGWNIPLDRLHGPENIGAMGIRRSMEPGSYTEYIIGDISATLYDPDNFFAPDRAGGLFRDRRSYLKQDHSAGGKVLHLVKSGEHFEAGDTLSICSNGNSENPVVETVDYSGTAEDVIILRDGLSYDHTGGTYVYVRHNIGKDILVRLGFQGITDKINLYTGYMYKNIERERGRAILNIREKMSLELKKNITIKSTSAGDLYEHAYESSMLVYDVNSPQNYMGGFIGKDKNYIMSRPDIGTIDHSAIGRRRQ